LSHDEMVSMYNLVRSALRAYHPLELQSLREDKEELVAQKTARLADFAATKIGHWLSDVVGIAIKEENRTAMLVVLNLLAAESD